MGGGKNNSKILGSKFQTSKLRLIHRQVYIILRGIIRANFKMENKLLSAEFRSSEFQDKTTCLKTLDSFTETLEMP